MDILALAWYYVRASIVQCNKSEVLIMESFPKGTPLDTLFDRLEKIMDKKEDVAEKRILELYDKGLENPTSARGMMNVVVEDFKMDCGCCYKLSRPAIDIIMTELTMLQFMIDEMENTLKKENRTDILEKLHHNKRILQVMLVGLKEMGASSEAMYDVTMKVYASTYHLTNPGNKKENFDHIIGMKCSINSTISRIKGKANAEATKEALK